MDVITSLWKSHKKLQHHVNKLGNLQDVYVMDIQYKFKGVD